jgi:hypothetical protein
MTEVSPRSLGWQIHGSVEDTKLSTNKQHSLSDLLLSGTLVSYGTSAIDRTSDRGRVTEV